MRVLVTGSGGLIGSEAVRFFLKANKVWGIDNNMRSKFFGSQGSVAEVINNLSSLENYTHIWIDITDQDSVEKAFKSVSPDVVIHCAAQPSHDKAADIPLLDFDVNARGTIILLEAFRKYCKEDAVFIHMSTNKVYGDGPNNIPLVELENRWEYANQLKIFQ